MEKVKKIIIAIVIIVVLLFVVVKFVSSKASSIEYGDSMYIDQFLETYTVKREDVKNYVYGIGQVTSFNIETLTIDPDEKISEILVSEGQKVEKNQDIMKVTDGSTTRTIKSTVSGLFYCIEENNVTKYCIYNLDDVGIKLALGEKEISSVSNGQKVFINISALDKDLEGTVEYVSSLPQNEKYIVRVKIDYTEDVKFGYNATASILTKEADNAIAIPYEYLNMDDDGKYFVYDANYKMDIYTNYSTGIPDYTKKYIEVGTITSTKVEVLSGLEAGDAITKIASIYF